MIKLRKPKDKRYKIDHHRKVKVYRNLHKNCFSIMQDSIVKAHADEVDLWDCAFQVNKAGYERTLSEGRKNVHAFVIGYMSEKFFGEFSYMHKDAVKVRYNPKISGAFFEVETKKSCFTALAVRLDSNGIQASFHDKVEEDMFEQLTITKHA